MYQSNVLFIIDMGTGVGVGWFFVNERQLSIFSISSTVGCIRGDHYHDRGGKSETRASKGGARSAGCGQGGGAPPAGWILPALLNDDHPPRRNYDKCGSHNGELRIFQECA